MTILPSIFITLFIAVVNAAAVITGAIKGEDFMPLLISLGQWISGAYIMMFLIGLVTTITENKRIHTSRWKKIKYLFTFPIFLFTYAPISVVAIFKNVEWEPTRHRGPTVSSEKIERTKEI